MTRRDTGLITRDGFRLGYANGTRPSAARTVLIIGGYGDVGLHIATHLHASDSDVHLVIAGRDQEQARTAAGRWGLRACGLAVDARDAAAVEGAVKRASLVILNTEAGTDTVARACIENGVSMISVAAGVPVLRGIASLRAAAENKGVSLVKDVGLAPGLTEMLARQAVERIAHPDRVEVFVELGLIGHHGHEATAWFLARIAEAGAAKAMPRADDVRHAIPIDFFDTREMAASLGSGHVASYFVPLPRWTAPWLARAAPVLWKQANLVRRASAFLALLLSLFGLPNDRWRLLVRATSSNARAALSLRGCAQSKITGILAAETALEVLHGDAPGGVVNMSDILVFSVLRKRFDELGLTLQIGKGA